MQSAFQAYLNYFDSLTPETVEDIRDLAARDMHFVDPFNDVRGVDAVINIFDEMYRKLKNPHFTVTESAESGNTLFVRWEFQFSLWALSLGRPQTITGVSIVNANEEGKIAAHIDYWDASTQVYMKIPVVGVLIRLLRHCLK